MRIKLQSLAPTFVEEEKIIGSQVWRNTLSFEPGERIQVIAPSGSGKTSFIHFLYGMRKDYSGEILVDEKNISSYDAEDFANYRRSRTSIVFQDLRLFTEQTVQQNLEVKRQLDPFHPEKKIAEMAKRLGIGSKLNKPCKTCSYGEQQRIAIIRALLQPFECLLLDEPLSHLDEANRRLAMELIEEEAGLRSATTILADLQVTGHFNVTRTLKL